MNFLRKSLLAVTMLALIGLLAPAVSATELGAQSPSSAEQDDPSQVKGKLIELSVLEGMANNANAGKLVTVLFTLERADAVGSAASVERTFDRDQAPSMQPVSRSNSIFITGTAAVVQEAVVRLRALDAATPEASKRNYRSQSPESIAGNVIDAVEEPQGSAMKFSMVIVVGGLALLAIFVAMVVRRPFR